MPGGKSCHGKALTLRVESLSAGSGGGGITASVGSLKIVATGSRGLFEVHLGYSKWILRLWRTRSKLESTVSNSSVGAETSRMMKCGAVAM